MDETAATSSDYPSANSFSRFGDEGNLLAMLPTVKPVALVADAILDCTSRGDIVLDSFLGSGTSIIAAERTGRRCYGLELDPLYVDTIVRRWQAFTRQDAYQESSGRSFSELEAQVKERDNGQRKRKRLRNRVDNRQCGPKVEMHESAPRFTPTKAVRQQ